MKIRVKKSLGYFVHRISCSDKAPVGSTLFNEMRLAREQPTTLWERMSHTNYLVTSLEIDHMVVGNALGERSWNLYVDAVLDEDLKINKFGMVHIRCPEAVKFQGAFTVHD